MADNLEDIIIEVINTLESDEPILYENLQYLILSHYDVTSNEYKISIQNLVKDNRIEIEDKFIYIK